jgi:hypothetical protein
MERFELVIDRHADIPATLSTALGNMGSLNVSREQWASLLKALGVDLYFEYHKDALSLPLDEAMSRLIDEAVPEAGQSHPQQASVEFCGPGIAEFITPGCVSVELRAVDPGVKLTVDFGRDSKHLATLVLADLYRRVPGAILLLAQAAQHAAQEYEQ